MENIHPWICNFGIWVDIICAVWWLTIILFVDGFQLKIEKKEPLLVIGFLGGAVLLFFSRQFGIKIGYFNFENIVFLIGIHLTIHMFQFSLNSEAL